MKFSIFCKGISIFFFEFSNTILESNNNKLLLFLVFSFMIKTSKNINNMKKMLIKNGVVLVKPVNGQIKQISRNGQMSVAKQHTNMVSIKFVFIINFI